MAENSSAEEGSSLLGEIVHTRSAVWWAGGAVALIAIAVGIWMARKWLRLPSDWLLPLGLVAGALLAAVMLWKVPQWQVGSVKNLDAKERFDRINDARKTLAQILGGIGLLAGFFGTWQNIKVAQTSLSVSEESAATSQRELTVSQEGQITDRFGKAIEQLGSVDSKLKKKLEVRLGGIYELEGIANESKELHWPIMEVLCTYVRVNAPLKSEISPRKNQTANAPPHPDADIQAILTVLGRRDRKHEKEDQRIDLSNTYLKGAYLTGTDLTGANLYGAYLRGAYLDGADLTVANLTTADLTDTDITGAKLRHTQGLTQEQVDSADGDTATQLPENLHMPESWKK